MTDSAPDAGSVTLTLDAEQQVATITVDRASKLNAVTPQMLHELELAARDADRSAARVVLLRTAGDKVFCVGADITLFSRLSPVEMWRQWTTEGHRAFAAVEAIRCPTIAVVDGLAFGGGLELALACDFRVTSAEARLALPETGLGTVPGWGGTARTTALIGTSRTKEMVLARREVAAAQALEWGLVNAVAPRERLEEEVAGWVERLLGSAPTALTMAKQLIDAAAAGAPAQVLESLAGGLSSTTDDLTEGVSAFREKRTAQFHGR